MSGTYTREWVGYRCDCGYVHENSPSNHVNVEPGDYCVKCGRRFSVNDRHVRRPGELFEWEKDEP